MMQKSDLIISLSNIGYDDKYLVGEKAAILGEMLKHGFPFPVGFVITPNAYRQFVLNNNLPEKYVKEIFRAYKRLEYPLKDATVEVLLSLPPDCKIYKLLQKKETAKGEAVLIEKIKSIFAYFFRTIAYFYQNGGQNVNFKPEPAIIVHKVPQTSNFGTIFTIDPVHNDKTKIVIKEGKTENNYEVLKKDLKITSKIINKGKVKMLTDKQIIDVAALGKKLQEYCYFPQEVRFAIERNKIFITQTKPITDISSKFPAKQDLAPRDKIQNAKLQKGNNKRIVLLKGNPLYSGIATGHLRIIQSMQDFNKILRGEIIVVPYQDLIKHPVIKAGAIVATNERPHQIPHLTLNSLFPGKPTIITTPETAKILRSGTVVTVNGRDGEVYMGSQWQR